MLKGMQFGVLAVLVWRCSQGAGQGATEMSHAIWGLCRSSLVGTPLVLRLSRNPVTNLGNGALRNQGARPMKTPPVACGSAPVRATKPASAHHGRSAAHGAVSRDSGFPCQVSLPKSPRARVENWGP